MSCRDYDCVEHAVDNGGCTNRQCEWSDISMAADQVIIDTIAEAIEDAERSCGPREYQQSATHVLAVLRGAGYEIFTTEEAKLISLENQPPSAPVAAEGDPLETRTSSTSSPTLCGYWELTQNRLKPPSSSLCGALGTRCCVASAFLTRRQIQTPTVRFIRRRLIMVDNDDIVNTLSEVIWYSAKEGWQATSNDALAGDILSALRSAGYEVVRTEAARQ